MHRRKLYFVIALTLLMVAGFMATSLISYFVARDSLSDSISEQMLPLTSDNIYSEIQRDLLEPITISSFMASDTFLRDWAIDGEQDEGRIRSYLSEIQQQYNTITAFFVSDATLNYYHPNGIIRTVDPDDPVDAWYARVRNMNAPYEINVDVDTADTSRLSIFINYRVHDYQDKYLGATGVGLAVSSVTEMINSYQERYGRTIYFLDRQGNVTLSGSGNDGMGRLQDRPGLTPFASRILSSPGTSLTYNADDGGNVYLNSRLVPEFNWYLVVEERSSEAEQRIANTLWLNIGLSTAIMLLVLGIAHFTLQSYQRRLEEMATTDRLTGAANRHMFDMLFEHARKLAIRRKRPISLISLDIDHFKMINDTYGHHAGDLMLQAISDIVRQHSRDSDTLCRWGGEEFILLLDDCPVDEAEERAEVIRLAIESESVPFGRETLEMTASMGVAECRPGENMEMLLIRVDKALYRAKTEGRNRVSVAT